MIDADFIVFFIACGSKSKNEKVPAQLVAVYEVIDHTVKKDTNGNYLLDIVEVADFKDLYDNKVFVDYVSCQEMTHDFAKCPKSVI